MNGIVKKIFHSCVPVGRMEFVFPEVTRGHFIVEIRGEASWNVPGVRRLRGIAGAKDKSRLWYVSGMRVTFK
jgi:hypothetical protein